MVFISKKVIKGKKRYYLECSVRLHSGKVKKFSLYLPDYPHIDTKKSEQQLQKKVEDGLLLSAAEYYEKGHIFTKERIKKLEAEKLGYEKIIKKITPHQLQDIIDRFTVNFTYESNAIEGNSLTLKDVTIILHENRILQGKDLREVHETLNTRKATGLLFHNNIRMSEQDIIALHKILVSETGVSLGYKKLPNFLLGRNVKTTLPENVAKEMKHVLDWYYRQKQMHPLQKAALFHGRFEKIHPFEDGNGRVGRLLINVILREHGFPPLIIRKTHRLAYFNALQACDAGHYEKLYWFLTERFHQTYEQFFQVYVKYL